MLASMYKGHVAYMHAVVWFSVVHLVNLLVLVCRRMRGPYQDIDNQHDNDEEDDSDEEHEEEHVRQGNEQLQNPAIGVNENQRLLPRHNEEEQPEQPAAADEQVPAEQPGAAGVHRCLLF